MEGLLETILANTFTKSDLEHRLGLLKRFLEFQFFEPHQKTNFLYLLNEFFVAQKESRDEFNALNFWANVPADPLGPTAPARPFFENFTPENFYGNLGRLDQAARRLPQVSLFLPFAPPIYEIPRLGGWFRQNVDPRMIIEVKTDPALIGGCALVYRGLYQDFSLRYFLEKNREKILRVLSDYLEAGGVQPVES